MLPERSVGRWQRSSQRGSTSIDHRLASSRGPLWKAAADDLGGPAIPRRHPPAYSHGVTRSVTPGVTRSRVAPHAGPHASCPHHKTCRSPGPRHTQSMSASQTPPVRSATLDRHSASPLGQQASTLQQASAPRPASSASCPNPAANTRTTLAKHAAGWPQLHMPALPRRSTRRRVQHGSLRAYTKAKVKPIRPRSAWHACPGVALV
jgi:hypothetical protein